METRTSLKRRRGTCANALDEEANVNGNSIKGVGDGAFVEAELEGLPSFQDSSIVGLLPVEERARSSF